MLLSNVVNWLRRPLQLGVFTECSCRLHTSSSLSALQILTRVRPIDNSSTATEPYRRAPKIIHIYKEGRRGKTIAGVGDKVLLAIRGQKMHALVVGVRAPSGPFVPKFDTNNVVLLDDKGNPAGNRITVPIPTSMRQYKKDHSKLISIATRFV